ncbi:MAG TPA: LamG-like jellyroll fold domain-containing protein, partial [Candidatus Latescibacteria bacterium]|nr:LamG-like jellyroll fold domain-containing protein [Candidatus Latescibacterota bacterium]
MRIFFILVLTLFTVSPALPERDRVQEGAQFLDGIGETGLIARYMFNGNAEDSSRNNFHATLHGTGAAFVEDRRFGRALNLQGDGSYVQLPGNALTHEDTISVTGWLWLNSDAPGQRFFDFGQSVSKNLAAAATDSFRASISSGAGVISETTGTEIPANQWVHLAVVLDPAGRTLTSYLNGVRAGQATNVTANAAQVIHQTSADANRLYIGRSQNDAAATLNARLRDVRIYRIALTDQQVAAIRNNASSGRQGGGGRGRTPAPVISTAAIPQESPLASQLEAVPDIKAETVAGQVPRLPYTIPAMYRDKAKGPDVRVVWPSPKDNSQFIKPGTYTVTGKVPGTPFQPKATVTVKEASKTVPVPKRLVEAFPLGQVVLDQ